MRCINVLGWCLAPIAWIAFIIIPLANDLVQMHWLAGKRALWEEGNVPKAVQKLQTALANFGPLDGTGGDGTLIAGGRAMVLYDLGTAYTVGGWFPEARAAFAACVARNPYAVWCLTNGAAAEALAGNWTIAETMLRQALAKVPRWAAARGNLAVVYANTGRSHQAQTEALTALHLIQTAPAGGEYPEMTALLERLRNADHRGM